MLYKINILVINYLAIKYDYKDLAPPFLKVDKNNKF